MLVQNALFLAFCSGLWVIHSPIVLASKSSSASNISSRSATSSAPTCPSGTVNYITHTLAQQCLTTSWVMPAITNSSATLPSTKPSGSFGTNNSNVHVVGSSSPASEDPSIPTSTASGASTSSHSSAKEETASSTTPEQESDTDSPLDNAKFLSFEDWKRQAVVKAEESAEKLEGSRGGGSDPRRRPGGINNVLDSLGDDAEIELDFPGFVPENAEPTAWGKQVKDTSAGDNSQGDQAPTLDNVPKATRRSKDAGKTCKERFNYASFDCAANVLKQNPECTGSASVLVENKDSYMLNECSAQNKFFIVELCNDILVDTIVLANFEFFSSIFRTFRVSVSDRYPVKLEKWKVLGTHEARNTREVQAFLIENPLIWARYLRIEFLTHYGNEYYCPVSLLRVHGTTPYEELKHEGENSPLEEEIEQDSASAIQNGEALSPEAVADPIVHELNARNIPLNNGTPLSNFSEATPARTNVSIANEQTNICLARSPAEELREFLDIFNLSSQVCHPIDSHLPSELPARVASSSASSRNGSFQTTTTSSQIQSCGNTSSSSIGSSNIATTGASSAESNTTRSPTKPPLTTSRSVNQTTPEIIKASSATLQSQARSASATTQSLAKSSHTSTQPHPPNPTTQESFLKSIHKRLQMLESNSTLSLLYIEEQSRILREAFSKVEKRQLSKTTTFLENLNVTVLSELRDFRQQYDQIWQSTVIELESQRELYQREVIAITARLSILADEVVFQKRMAIIQSTLVLICLGLFLFSRGNAAQYLELPMMQSMLSRSQSTFFRSSSPSFETPSGSPVSTRPNSSSKEKRHFNLFRRHKRGLSDDSRDGALSPTIHYSPPTPTSDRTHSDLGMDDDQSDPSRASSPVPDIDPTTRPMSSPPTLGLVKAHTEPIMWGENKRPDSETVITSVETDQPAINAEFDRE